jgi:hypothetical protein
VHCVVVVIITHHSQLVWTDVVIFKVNNSLFDVGRTTYSPQGFCDNGYDSTMVHTGAVML